MKLSSIISCLLVFLALSVTFAEDVGAYHSDRNDTVIDIDIKRRLSQMIQPPPLPIGDVGDFIDQNGCTVNIDISIDTKTGMPKVSTMTNCDHCNCPAVPEQH